MSGLPKGFVLDEAPQQSNAGLPEGFVLDAAPTAQPEQPQEASRLASAIGAVAQGGTFSFGDEIEAGLASVFPIDRMVQADGARDIKFGDFKGNLEQIRERNAVQKASNPKTFLAGELVGALVTGGGSLARQGAVKGGAIVGGVVGAGNAEGNALERVDDAAKGAALGAVAGKVGASVLAPIASKLSGVFDSTLKRALAKSESGKSLTRPQRKVLKKYKEILQDSGITPEEFQKKIATANEAGLDDMFMFELAGDPAVLAAKGLAAKGNTKAFEGIKRVRARQTMQQSRVETELKKAFGGDGSDYIETGKAFDKAKKAAKPYYDKFYALEGTPTSEVLKVLGRDFETIVSQASASVERRSGQALATDSPVLSPQVLDRIKRTLSERTQTAKRSGDATAYGDNVAQERRFVEFLDEKYPEIYAKARATYAGPAKQKEALELGETLIRKTNNKRNPENIRDMVGRMSDDETEAFRAGVARAIRQEMAKGNRGTVGGADFGDPGNLIKRFFGSTEKQEAIRAAFGNDNQFARFAKKVAKLDEQSEAFRQVNVQRTGSPTAALEGAKEKVVDLGTDALEAKGGNVFAVKRIAQRFFPKSEKLQNDMADFLFSQAPKRQEEIKAVLIKLKGDERDKKLRELIEGSAAIGSAKVLVTSTNP